MKKTLHLFLVLCFCTFTAFAQSGDKTIIEDLNSPKLGQGKIKVMQDETIEGIVAVRQAGNVADTTKALGVIDPTAEYTKVKGYKIQVFSGNNQQQSKREAEYKQSQVRGAYPDMETTVSFHSPFWRLRVGNFLKREDAEAVLKEMKSTFPSFGREMYVVSDVVKRVSE